MATSTLDILTVLPELWMAFAGMVLLMLGAFGVVKTPGSFTGLSILLLGFAATLVVAEFGVELKESFGGLLVHSDFNRVAKLLLLLSGVLVLVLAHDWIVRFGSFELPIIIVFALIGLMLLISAHDLMTLYVALELGSLSLYILAAYRRDNLKSTEAGLKYFTLGALASGMLLFGASLIYGFAGTTGFSALEALLVTPPAVPLAHAGLMVGLVLVITGFAFKLSAVPFHMWTPDVYEGAPTPVTAFFATAPKIAVLILFSRLLADTFGALTQHWQPIIMLVSVASMFLGALAAIMQTNIKRLLAYSSIGHVGYMLIGVAAGTKAGLEGVLIYLALYLFMSLGAFGFVLTMRRGGEPVEEIASLSGLSRRQPVLALLFSVFLFGMAGIPFFSGFFGKLYIFLSAVDAGLYTLAVLGLLASVVAAYYYIRIVKIMYFDEPATAFDKGIPPSLCYLLAICALVTLCYVLMPSPLVRLVKGAVESMALS